MDYAAIALGIYTVLSPFVTKGLEKIVDKASEEGWAERQKVWEWLKGVIKRDDEEIISIFKEADSDPEKKGELKGEIKANLQLNEAKAKELEALVNTIKEIEKRNSSTVISEDIRGNSQVENTVEQTTGSATSNESSITNRNIENSKIITRIIQK